MGCLLHNVPPSLLFVGYAVSLCTGCFLALGSILVTFYNPNWGYDPLLAMMAPALIFSVPIYDTLSVMLIRMRLRKPLFVGDRNHLPHRLQALGLSSRESLLVITLLTLATSAAAVYVTSLTRFQALVVLFQTLAMFIILFILETAGERRR